MTWTYRIEQDMIRGEPVAVITDGAAYFRHTLEELAAWHATTMQAWNETTDQLNAAWVERDDLKRQLNGGGQ